MQPLTLILLLSLFVCFIIAISVIAYQKQQKRLVKVLESLAGPLSGAVQGKCLIARLEETPYKLQFAKQGKGPALAVITIPGNAGFIMAVRKRMFLDSWGERLGLTSPPDIPDKDFLKDHYVHADNLEKAAQVLWRQDALNAIRGLLETKMHYLRLDETGASLVIPLASMAEKDLLALTPGEIRGKAAKLFAAVGAALQPARNPVGEVKPFSASALFFDKKQSMIMAMATSLPLIVSLILMILAKKMYTPLSGQAMMSGAFRFSIMPTVIGVLLFLFAGRLWFRKTPESHRLFMVFSLLIPMTFFMACIAGFMFTNGALDSSPAVFYTTEVAGKKVYHGKGAHYSLSLAPWSGKKGDVRFSISEKQYEQFEIGQKVTLGVRSGMWGYEWVSSPPIAAQ
ncbi:hypothetical protein SAMN02745216_01212 [Desulfatibacillum alkenivorans DSM 16219]|jgi:hypothetical protein|uniref:Uncharacterized protein n=1 Tax=Desulfatibacillum alkenivorans DSM 16219 TaxID=1121393 RepID=A0A1M6HFF0_9BACT|nr:hypothetical protein [Desulfatibacillum alkenivorans]SHJ20958.1 hypothetical protein SAMN02745216_01212 [Desulfatibacillum alkenivorans DSM 16219]